MDYQVCLGLLFIVTIVAWISAEVTYYRGTKNDWIILRSGYWYRRISNNYFNLTLTLLGFPRCYTELSVAFFLRFCQAHLCQFPKECALLRLMLWKLCLCYTTHRWKPAWMLDCYMLCFFRQLNETLGARTWGSPRQEHSVLHLIFQDHIKMSITI